MLKTLTKETQNSPVTTQTTDSKSEESEPEKKPDDHKQNDIQVSPPTSITKKIEKEKEIIPKSPETSQSTEEEINSGEENEVSSEEKEINVKSPETSQSTEIGEKEKEKEEEEETTPESVQFDDSYERSYGGNEADGDSCNRQGF